MDYKQTASLSVLIGQSANYGKRNHQRPEMGPGAGGKNASFRVTDQKGGVQVKKGQLPYNQ